MRFWPKHRHTLQASHQGDPPATLEVEVHDGHVTGVWFQSIALPFRQVEVDVCADTVPVELTGIEFRTPEAR